MLSIWVTPAGFQGVRGTLCISAKQICKLRLPARFQARPYLLRYAMLQLCDGCANFRKQLDFIRADVQRYRDGGNPR